MGKMHLNKDDIKKLIAHLKSYDHFVVVEVNNVEDAEKRDEWIDEHNSVESLIETLERK
jgi:hypothetical protein